jgi:hypothetical protein
MVSRIGVELFVTVGDGRSGYRVARPLSEVGDRISAEASVPR